MEQQPENVGLATTILLMRMLSHMLQMLHLPPKLQKKYMKIP